MRGSAQFVLATHAKHHNKLTSGVRSLFSPRSHSKYSLASDSEGSLCKAKSMEGVAGQHGCSSKRMLPLWRAPYKSHVTITRCQSPSFTLSMVLLLTKNLTSTVGIGSRILSSNSVCWGGGACMVYLCNTSH